jgi:hypothetical protein
MKLRRIVLWRTTGDEGTVQKVGATAPADDNFLFQNILQSQTITRIAEPNFDCRNQPKGVC